MGHVFVVGEDAAEVVGDNCDDDGDGDGEDDADDDDADADADADAWRS